MSAVPNRVHMELAVNGETTPVSFAPYKTLLEVLREDLDSPGPSTAVNWASAAPARVLDGQPMLSAWYWRWVGAR
jgi:aerobic-type carbon monoxide dehydrogenase small subunit (CoxS/CutS family)